MTATAGRLSEFSALVALIDTLRARGVRVFHGELAGKPVVVELGPAVEAPVVVAPKVDETLCKCKCADYAHTSEGFCINGCEPEACTPKELQ